MSKKKKAIVKHEVDLVQSIIKTRGATYGDFNDNALVSQGIKDAMKRHPLYERLKPVTREMLDMIAIKMARIVTGDPAYRDNYDDIQGYAKITGDRV